MTAAPSILLGSLQILAQNVSLVVKFLLPTFYLRPRIFCQENYLKILLQFPAGHMKQPLNGFYSFMSDRIAIKTGAAIRGK
jgi:hypothetical protein